MKEIIKKIENQDAMYKETYNKSKETSINLSKDIADFIGATDGDYVTFKIFRDDFIKALCLLITKLPLFSRFSIDTFQPEEFSFDWYKMKNDAIVSFFGMDETKEYSVQYVKRGKGNNSRHYLQRLENGIFNFRDFTLSGYSYIIFQKDDEGQLILRLQNKEPSKIIIEDKSLKHFVYKVFKEIYSVDKFDTIKPHLIQSLSIRDSATLYGIDEDEIYLSGLFVECSKEQIENRNLDSKRWFTPGFEVDNKIWYLSDQWYGPLQKDNGSKYPLSFESLRLLLNKFYSSYEVAQENGLYLLKSKVSENSSASVHSFSPESEPFSVSAVIEAVKSTGLLYDDLLIKRFAYSLLSKRFLILSGLAGSGKTQLALAFSKAMIESEKQLCVVSVGADWTNREPLLGYPNALKSGSYVKPESGVLDLLIEANSDPERPYFLILDEMNLSVVERYFADFLSAMESHQPIALWKSEDDASEVPETVSLPDNLFIIGTINVDETTYMFSPKVLDRAHVLEFKISSDEMEKFLSEMRPVNVAEVLAACAGMGKEFVKAANSSPAVRTEINVILLEFFKQLKRVNAEFGYRSVMEINSFISKGLECEQENSESSLNLDCLTDCAIVQKLLPKLHGSRKKLSEVLESLWLLCFDQDSAGKEAVPEIETCDLSGVQNVRYVLSADKIQRMYITAVRNGFTSFAEA